MKNLILGDGLLGNELFELSGWESVSRNEHEVDAYKFNTFVPYLHWADTIINCIGYTNTYDTEREKHWKINYEFVVNLVDFCKANNKKLVQISTDYVYCNSKNAKSEEDIPVHQETWYSYCKLLADAYVQLKLDNYLMFRCSFKPKPFPYEKAFTNVCGNFDYVDVLAKQMIEMINEDRQGIWNIGTGYKSMVNLAKQTKPDVGEWWSEKLPSINMDLRKYQNRNK